MTSKITNAQVLEGIQQLRGLMKERKFRESIELQIALKDYDPAKDKRFVGTVRLPNMHRPSLKICLIADARHQQEAEKEKIENLDVTTLDELKKFNKDKKLVKKWAKKYSLLLASDTVLKKVPTVVGPILTRINRFPTVVGKEPLRQKIVDTRASVKFQLKKVTCMATAVGTQDMTDDEIKQNVSMALNFLASLTKKGWHNIKSVYIKSTMSPAVKLL